MQLSVWLTFFAAAWAISLSPGPGAVAALSAGMNHGFARGYCITFGLVLGIWTQVLIVGLGLGALIATSALAFGIFKWLGVAYLVWIGVMQWRAPATPLVAASAEPKAVSRRSLFMRGWGINAVNPKGTVFMLAVVPQFLDLTQALPRQYLVIALTLAFTDLIVMAGYTALASRLLRLLTTSAQMRLLNRAFGSLFVTIGVLLAMFKRG